MQTTRTFSGLHLAENVTSQNTRCHAQRGKVHGARPGHRRLAPRRRVHHPVLSRLPSSHTPGFLGQETDDLALICAETVLRAKMPYFSTNCLLNNHTMMPDDAPPPSLHLLYSSLGRWEDPKHARD